MKKKLKIQFWKAEKALVAQIMEQEGINKGNFYDSIEITDRLRLWSDHIEIGEGSVSPSMKIAYKVFESNASRDEYLKKIIIDITNEIFCPPVIGKEYLFSDDIDFKVSHKLRLAKIDMSKENPYLSETDIPNKYLEWKYIASANANADRHYNKKESGDILICSWNTTTH